MRIQLVMRLASQQTRSAWGWGFSWPTALKCEALPDDRKNCAVACGLPEARMTVAEAIDRPARTYRLATTQRAGGFHTWRRDMIKFLAEKVTGGYILTVMGGEYEAGERTVCSKPSDLIEAIEKALLPLCEDDLGDYDKSLLDAPEQPDPTAEALQEAADEYDESFTGEAAKGPVFKDGDDMIDGVLVSTAAAPVTIGSYSDVSDDDVRAAGGTVSNGLGATYDFGPEAVGGCYDLTDEAIAARALDHKIKSASQL